MLGRGSKEFEIGGRNEIMQTTALLRSARILRRVLEIWKNSLSLRLYEISSANTGVKNSIIMIIINRGQNI